MIRTILTISAYFAICLAQPPTCQEDSQCTIGQYCEQYSLTCHKCLLCEDLKRDPPKILTPCIKSVVECGACFTGLIEDRSDVNAPCISHDKSVHDSQQLQEGPPAYVWVLIVVGVAVFVVLIVLIVIYMFKKNPLTIKASTHTSVRSPGCGAAASAPVLPPPPPPYYDAVHPSAPGSPASSPWPSESTDAHYDEEWPLNVKRASISGPRDTRESATNQAALVYNNPAYVRVPEQPSINTETITIEDDETRISTWTPYEQVNNNDVNGNPTLNDGSSGNAEAAEMGAGGAGGTGGASGEVASGPDLTTLLAGARTTTLVRPRAEYAPPAKMMRFSQDSNNNRDRRSDEPTSGHGASENAQSGPSFTINLVQNINAVYPNK